MKPLPKWERSIRVNISRLRKIYMETGFHPSFTMDFSTLRYLFIGILVGCYIGYSFIFLTRRLDCLVKQFEGNGAMVFPSLGRLVRNNEDFLFVGVMTVRQHLNTRAKASYLTWAREIPGRVVYFVGDGEPYNGDLDVVVLKGVAENDYPPRRKSFAMIQYIYQHYADEYQWYIRADDDMYIKVKELTLFLKSINNRGYRYIGQPGFGLPGEKGKLGLGGAFCMGGPGVIMSPKLLRDVAPYLHHCLNKTSSAHEDTELGRCILRATGRPCTSAYDMKNYFYQNYKEIHLQNSSFKKELGEDEIDALTLHPVKDHTYAFRLDTFLSQNKLANLQRKVEKLRHEIAALPLYSKQKEKNLVEDFKRSTLPGPSDKRDALEPRDYNKEKTKTTSPSSSWDFVLYTHIHSCFLDTGKIRYPLQYRGRNEMHGKMVEAVKAKDNLRLPGTTSVFVNNTLQKLSTDKGLLGFVFTKRWLKGKMFIRPYLFHQPFSGPLEYRESLRTIDRNPATIYMLVPIFQRSSVFKRFLDNYATAVNEYAGEVKLIIAMFRDNRDEDKVITDAAYTLMRSFPRFSIAMLSLDPPFNRGKGLMAAINQVSDSSLLLLMDVDMEFSSQFLHRVSTNTVEGKAAFFPIYFVHYDPQSVCFQHDDCEKVLQSKSDETGQWRSFSYGIVSIYKSDVLRAGGFRKDIVGWGLEDVDFYEKCLNLGLKVIRAADPGLTHRYHSRHCDSSLPEEQLRSCQDSGNAMLGSVKSLYRMLTELVKVI